jgi:hypothetical protein
MATMSPTGIGHETRSRGAMETLAPFPGYPI